MAEKLQVLPFCPQPETKTREAPEKIVSRTPFGLAEFLISIIIILVVIIIIIIMYRYECMSTYHTVENAPHEAPQDIIVEW